MRKLIALLAMASILAGCASTLPTCDGKNRRPINDPVHAGVRYPNCGSTV